MAESIKAPETLTLVGKSWPVTLPGFAEREELAQAMFQASGKLNRSPGLSLRVAAAAIGFCTQVGQAAGATYARCDYDVLTYGGRVYDWLRKQGADQQTVATLGGQLIASCAQDLFPRAEEIKSKVSFTGAPGEAAS